MKQEDSNHLREWFQKHFSVSSGDLDYVGILGSYLNEDKVSEEVWNSLRHEPADQSKQGIMQNNKASLIAGCIYYGLNRQKDTQKILQTVSSLAGVIRMAKRSPEGEIRKRADLFKEGLQIYASQGISVQKNKWQDILLQLDLKYDQQASLLYVPTYHAALGKPLQVKEKDKYRSASMLGSSYCTNSNMPYIHQDEKDNPANLVLDAYCTGSIVIPKGKVFFGAIADGAGGHMDALQDKAIGRTAKYICSYAIRYMGFYVKHYGVKKLDWDGILERVAMQIPYKTVGFMENASMLCYMVYPKGEGYMIQGMSIGDCLLAVWDPIGEECTTIAPARVTGGWGPALFPIDKKGIWFERQIGKGNRILAMTDGVYQELLPKKEVILQGEKVIHETYLDKAYMQTLLSGKATAVELRIALEEAISTSVQKAITGKQGEWKTGDDIGLVITELPYMIQKRGCFDRAPLNDSLSLG